MLSGLSRNKRKKVEKLLKIFKFVYFCSFLYGYGHLTGLFSSPPLHFIFLSKNLVFSLDLSFGICYNYYARNWRI